MKINISILVFIFGFSHSYCQSYPKNIIEISTDIGLSTDLNSTGNYFSTSTLSSVYLTKKSFTRSRNIALSYTKFWLDESGIKFLIGMMNYGFHFEGFNLDSQAPLQNTYRVTFLEWGVSYVHKLNVSENMQLLLEPGIRHHTHGEPESNSISLSEEDSFSLSIYSGLEFPMIGNKFFANAGLQLKIPLQDYNHQFSSSSSYYPFFMGIKVGVNYQF